MVLTSHLIEELVAEAPERCVLLSGFQHGRHWAVERDRYLELAGGNDVIAVFAGEDPPATWDVEHVGIRLDDGNPLTQEWFVLALGPGLAVTLCGLDAGTRVPTAGEPPPDDTDRLFEVIWSFDPGVAQGALDVVLGAVAQSAPDRVAEVRAAWTRSRRGPWPPTTSRTAPTASSRGSSPGSRRPAPARSPPSGGRARPRTGSCRA
jgi:DICT domain-containing protein